MNIFWLDDNPDMAAQMHCDKHVVKMVLETAQILSTAWHILERKDPSAAWVDVLHMAWEAPRGDTPPRELTWLQSRVCGNRVYNATHANHPCMQWAALYGGNYQWLYRLGCALLDEYTYRFGRVHATLPVIRALELVPQPLTETVNMFCESPLCMPAEYIVHDDAVASYRRYYKLGKADLLSYTRRLPPEWLGDSATFKEAA